MNSHPLIYLAPFQGITGSVFLEVYSRHFPYVDKLFTPFFTGIRKQKSILARRKELEYTERNGIPVVPQILSKDAEEIIRFGHCCHESGFNEINWNLGCPFPRVAAKKRGSGMLPFPLLVNDILENVMPRLPNKLSIKCRLGYESPGEIEALIPVFNKFPLSEIIIHARLGKQVYKGDVDIETFKTTLTQSKLPVVYNGDIFSVKDFRNLLLHLADVTTFMIGRGLLVDPTLPEDIKREETKILYDKTPIVRKFADDLYYAYRKNLNDRLHAINMMKELWEYMAWSFENPHKVFSLVKKTKSFDEYEDAVNKVFDEFEWLGSSAEQFNSSSI